jgi:hypothetical protein
VLGKVWSIRSLLCYLSATLFLSLPLSNFMDFGHAANNLASHRSILMTWLWLGKAILLLPQLNATSPIL